MNVEYPLRDRKHAFALTLQDIDVVQLQALQALLHGVEDVLRSGSSQHPEPRTGELH